MCSSISTIAESNICLLWGNAKRNVRERKRKKKIPMFLRKLRMENGWMKIKFMLSSAYPNPIWNYKKSNSVSTRPMCLNLPMENLWRFWRKDISQQNIFPKVLGIAMICFRKSEKDLSVCLGQHWFCFGTLKSKTTIMPFLPRLFLIAKSWRTVLLEMLLAKIGCLGSQRCGFGPAGEPKLTY